jgi:glutaredoxin
MEPAFTIYSKPDCPYCDDAKTLIEQHGEKYNVITLGVDLSKEAFVKLILARTGKVVDTVPQVFLTRTYIGGFTDLASYYAKEDKNTEPDFYDFEL